MLYCELINIIAYKLNIVEYRVVQSEIAGKPASPALSAYHNGFVTPFKNKTLHREENMENKRIPAAKAAATYIGVVVGAGFATGQEMLQFFVRFGPMGVAGILLATALFILFGFIIMDLGRELKASSHLEIIRYAGGRFLGFFMDLLISFFLFGSLTAMIAGTGALFKEQLNLPSLAGNLVMCAFTALTVMSGIRGVVNSISFVVPLLLISVVGISLYSIAASPPAVFFSYHGGTGGGLLSGWLMSAVVYVSYNIIISASILGPLGMNTGDRKAIKYGAILGGMGLGLASFMIHLALTVNYSEVSRLEVPMIFIAGRISEAVRSIYAVILVCEIYTTAVGSLYGFVSRIGGIKKVDIGEKSLILVSSSVALLASQLGFSNMVKYLYPLVGYGGTVFLLSLIYVKIRKRPFG